MSVRIVRSGLSSLFALALCAICSAAALAVETGTISGTVIDLKNSAPISGAKVTAISPSGNSFSTTDAHGFYIIQGLQPDTYQVEVQKQGYQVSLTPGVTVIQGAVHSLDVKLAVELKTLGKVTIRGQATLVTPNLPTDTYNIGTTQLEQLGGTPMNDNEAVLIEDVPGVSATGGAGSASGLQGYYPLIRGGLENNEGFQLEGINATEPTTNQFINNLILNGARSVNIVAGPGDATQGGAASGYVNIVTKTGAYPSFANFGIEVGGPAFEHNLKFEYGGATPDQRFTYFFSGRYDRNYGGCCSPPFANLWGLRTSAHPDAVGQLDFVITNDTMANFTYKFGKDNRNQIQLWQDYGANGFIGDHGINPNLEPYPSNDPFIQFVYGLFGLNANQIPFFTGNPRQVTFNQNIGWPQYQFGTFSLTKIGFSRQINDTTYLKTSLYRTQDYVPFGGADPRVPYLGYGFASFGFGDFWESVTSQNTGIIVDLQKAIAEKHLVTVGFEHRFSRALLDVSLPSATIFFSGFFPDFIKGSGTPFAGDRLPTFDYIATGPEWINNAYIQDNWKLNSHLTLQPGLRYEAQKTAPGGSYPYYVNAWSPRMSATYGFNDNGRTVIRATYGRATIFAPLGQIYTIYNPPDVFHSFPATTKTCGGVTGSFSLKCADYWDQIFNAWWQGLGLDPYAFPKAQKSDTFDISFEHEFAHNVQVKITPYHRHDYDVITFQSVAHYAGTTVLPTTETVTNAGFGETTGVEAAVSRQVQQGLSVQLNLTYINQFINYLSTGAFFPAVQPNILQTHTSAHPSYLSPFNGTLSFDYRRNGWRVDPIVNFNVGYPIGVWQTWPVKINGQYVPIPNTNLFGNPNGYCFYVDPQAPGTAQSPNIVGSLGGGCTKALHGQRTKPVAFLNFVVARDIGKHATVGIDVQNVFNNVANYPYFGAGSAIGSYVNNGFGAYGPGSGTNPNAGQFPGVAPSFAQYGRGPWFNIPSGPGIEWTFFATYKL